MNLFGSALESAVRSLLVAGVVWAGLRVFRVRNVLALKTVWGLVLAAAVAMPLLLPVAARWKALPVGATVVLPASMQKLLGVEPQFAQAPKATRAVEPYAQPMFAAVQAETTRPHERATRVEKFPAAGRPEGEDSYFSSEIQASKYETPAVSRAEFAAPVERWGKTAAQTPSREIGVIGIAWLLYLGVATALLLRMLFGVAAAYRIWQRAEPVETDALFGIDGRQVRASRAVASPVTIGSGIVLPAEFAEWDAEKLRIVLAHERSHIRQKDFYLQLLAGLHAIAFWFSPLGWWLKSRLSDLAEAISDRAGLCEAASRSAYAQVLLEFAARPHPTHVGVAMARKGSLSRRIDRVLNDNVFQQAFTASRTRIAAAVLLVPAALFAAMTLVRVQAAAQTTPQPTPAAQQAPDAMPTPAAQPTAAPEAAPQAAPATPDVTPTPAPAAPATNGEAMQDIAPPSPPVGPIHVEVPKTVIVIPKMPPMPPMKVVVPRINIVVPKIASMPPMPKMYVLAKLDHLRLMGPIAYSVQGPQMIVMKDGRNVYQEMTDGDEFVLVRRNGGNEQFSGGWAKGHEEEIAKAGKLAHGDFLWFTRDGKSYYIDDPATVSSVEASMEAMQAQQKELGTEQEALGRLQEDLAKQQEDMHRDLERVSMTTPNMNEEIAKVQAVLAELQAKQGSTMTTKEWGDIESKLGELQAKLGQMRAGVSSREGSFGSKMGELGAREGELGAKQGRLGERQARLAMAFQQKVKATIDESLAGGKAHPVQ